MNAHADFPTQLDNLLSKVLDGALDADEQASLDDLLQRDPRARQRYHEHIALHALLHWRELEASADAPDTADPLEPPILFDPWTESDDATWSIRSTLVSGLFSYTAAAVLLAILLLAGWAWRISLPMPARHEPGGTDITRAVARITALADCQWHNEGSGVGGQGAGIPKTKDLRPKTIYLGDRFSISSGLMEITYDTGAKVILQGPCLYEVDSARGGFLAVGKLTARIVASGQWPVASKTKQKKHEAESLTTGHRPLATALFAVRTPTATVTDLGTEFGVEVEESGATHSHVFQGSVELRENIWRQVTCSMSVEILHAGESARVERGRNNKMAIVREAGQPERFIREISKSPNLQISKSHSLIPGPRSLIPRYHLTDLGTLGGEVSCAIAVNASGQIVGEALTLDGMMHAFLYVDGKMKDLGTLRGGNSRAYGINSFGKIVGQSGREDAQRAFVFSEGDMKDLGMFGGATACAMGINDSDVVAGHAQTSGGITHAFLFDSQHGMKDLGSLGGSAANSWAKGLNASALVTGYSETANGAIHAFLYSDASGMRDLGTLGGGQSKAFHMNDLGQVVGQSIARDGRQYAFIYRDGSGMRNLVPKRTVAASQAIDINNQGQIVGVVEYLDGEQKRTHAFLCSDGNTVGLDSLIHPETDWTDFFPTAINASGQIVGFGRAPNGYTRAFLLTPATKGLETTD